MTDRPRPRIRVPGPFPVLAGSLGAFFAVLGGLAIEDRGNAAAAPVAAPRVIERRVVLTRIVIHERPGARVPRPRTTTAPAPAPAPPAPRLTTRTS